jgi:DNA topoisomerase-1
VTIKTGQFGAYVSDTFVNATIPKDDNIEDMTAERAYELLAIRREKLGLAPGESPAKTTRGKKAPTTKRVVKRGATRKK